jgi:hypothetical protein
LILHLQIIGFGISTDPAGCRLNRKTSRAKANYGTNSLAGALAERDRGIALRMRRDPYREGEQRAFFAKRTPQDRESAFLMKRKGSTERIVSLFVRIG